MNEWMKARKKISSSQEEEDGKPDNQHTRQYHHLNILRYMTKAESVLPEKQEYKVEIKHTVQT